MSQATAFRQSASALPRALGRPGAAGARLRVVPAAIERSGTGKFASMCIVLLAIGLLTLLLLNAQLAQGSYTLHDLRVMSGTLSDQEHELTRALDAERNPGALARRALAMGMVPATSMAFIRLDDGTILGVAEPAVAKPLAVIAGPRVRANAPAAAPLPATQAPQGAATSDPDVPDAAGAAQSRATAPGTVPATPTAPTPSAAVPGPTSPVVTP